MKRSKMKTMKKRILALLLCGTMVLNTGVSASADEGTTIIPENTHVHTEECYEKSKTENLICTKPEVTEEAAHVHEEKCFEVTFDQKLTCTQEETEGHSHGDGCVETKDVLTCGTDEHTHGGECYTTETKNVCGQEESETHTHDAGCVEETETLTCSVSEHTHSGECYTTETHTICDQEEKTAHTHGEGCYTTVENKTQICTLEEAEAHTHSDDCYEWEEKLICTIEETALAKQVKEEPVQKTSVEGTKEAEKKEPVEVNIQNADETGITVSIKSTSDVLAEDAKVVVAPMEADEEIETALAEAAGELDVLGYVAYDISLKNADDTDVSLGENKVDVAIDFAEAIPEGIDAEEVKEVVLAHITTDEEGNVAAETVGTVEVTEDKKATKAEFEAASFSPYVVTWLGEVAEEVDEEPVEEKGEPTVLTWEDEKIFVTLSAEAGVVPEGAILSVTPILEENEETQDKYAEVAEQLADKVAEENEANNEYKEVAGFLAYDIKLVLTDENGIETKVDPAGDVKVTMEYKESAIPEEVKALENAEVTEVTLMHHKEDENGVVENVINMVAEETIEATVTTVEEAKVENAEFVTDSFSVFTITWVREGDSPFAFDTNIHYGYLSSDNKYVGFTTNPLEGITVKSTGTPPTLYMDTITKDGENSDIYTFNEDETTYFFAQAYVAQINTDNTYTVINETPIISIQAKAQDVVRYMLRDAGEYQELQEGETIFFVYVMQTEAVAHYYKEDGTILHAGEYSYADKEIYQSKDGVKVNNFSELSSETQIDKAYNLSGTSYKYAYTLLDVAGKEITPSYIRYNNGNLQYRTSENTSAEENEWSSIGAAEIKLIYILNDAIATVDTAGLIDINLYDYKNYKKFGSLEFVDGWGYGSDEWNKWNSSSDRLGRGDYAVQGIVDNVLYDSTGANIVDADENYQGYPKMAVGQKNSLAEIFGGKENEYVTSYKNLNHLFKINDQGYYEYNSESNEAYYDSANQNKNFIVYGTSNSYGKGFGQFMPLARLKYEVMGYQNYDDEDGDDTRYHFGMNIGFNFTQPEGGELSNGDKMKFQFSGDDDVWVFIDGQLVLDIGGIHGAVTGTIDFSTGDVSITPGAGTVTGTSATATTSNTTLGNIFNLQTSTFEDGTTHRLEFFYLERGQNVSNCMLQFNIPPQYPNNVEIEKEIVNTDKQKYSNVEFDFKLYVEDTRNSGDPGNFDLMPEGTPYTIKKDGEVVGIGRVGANGIFTLKHGESATFGNIHPGIRYYVEEVSVNSTEFDKVIVNDEEAKYYDQNGNEITDKSSDGEGDSAESVLPGSKEYIARTSKLLAGEVGKVLFQNRCSAANKRELKVSKLVSGGGTPDESDYFTFKIYLSENGQLVPYAGEYYLVEDGNTINNGNPSTTEDGIVEVKAGQSVVITGIMSDTEFMVEEIWPEGTEEIKEKYDESYSKEVSGAVTDAEQLTIQGSDGAIMIGTDAEVTITNYLDNSYKNVSFKKIWDDYNDTFGVRPEKITVTLTGKVGEKIVYENIATVKKSDDWTYIWEEVPVYHEGTKIEWSVSEEEVSGYTPDYNGSSEEDALITVDKVTVPNSTTSYTSVADSQIPATPVAVAVAYNLRNSTLTNTYNRETLTTVNETGISTYASGTSTYAGGRPGGSSSSTFNHFDIQAYGSYEFLYAGEKYTVDFDFYEGVWTLTDADGEKVSSGALDVTDFKITNLTTKEDITSEGSWQQSNISGQDYEFRISGSFNRSDKFKIYFEIPIVIDGVTINLVSDFDTYYTDPVYNVCPGGGIDIKLDEAIDQAIQFNVIALEKTFTGLESVATPNTTFTIQSADGGSYSQTLTYSDFANGYTGSTSLSNVPAGKYTITENVGDVEGYTATGTTINVVGAANVTKNGKSATFTVEQGTVVSISYVNSYTNVPQTHEIMMQKVWVDNKDNHPNVSLKATLSDGSTWEETLTDAKLVVTKEVDADVTIKEIKEVTTLSDYKTTTSVSGNSAVVVNTLSSSDTTTATVAKVWNDENDKYGKRPESIQVVLYQKVEKDGRTTESVYGNATLSEDNGWTYTFTGLPNSETTGTETTTYSYYVKEVSVPGYISSGRAVVEDGTATITNTLDTAALDEEFYIVNTLRTKEVTLNKYWNDANNKYGSRPGSITLNLLSGENVLKSVTLGSSHGNDNKWSATFVVPANSSGYGISETFPKEYDSEGKELENYYQSMYDVYTTTDSNDELSIVNTPNQTSIVITKIWNDAENAYGKRPESISFKLQYKLNGTETWQDYTDESATYEMVGEDCADQYHPKYWYYIIDGLPITKDGQTVEYRVEEIVTEQMKADGYVSVVDGASTMVNSLKAQIVKRSASEGNPVLEGAIFKAEGTKSTYYGKSGANGVISWYGSYNEASGEVGEPLNNLPDGKYMLSEIKAPAGYVLSEETFNLEMIDGLPAIIGSFDDDGNAESYVEPTLVEVGEGDAKVRVYTYYIDNEVLYELPSTGGNGIHFITLSGLTLMLGAAYVWFMNRRKEML